MPLDALVPTGTLSTKNLYILPFDVNIIRVSIVLVDIEAKIEFSSVLTPLPLRRWVLKLPRGIRLISPFWLAITTTSSGTTSMISFSSFGISICCNSVLLASPYFVTRESSLPRITSCCRCLFAKIFLYISIALISSCFSWLSSTASNLARELSLIAKIAFACASVKSYFFIKLVFAAALLSDDLISAMILSISSNAASRPLTICSLSWAFCKSNCVSLITQFILCSI